MRGAEAERIQRLRRLTDLEAPQALNLTGSQAHKSNRLTGSQAASKLSLTRVPAASPASIGPLWQSGACNRRLLRHTPTPTPLHIAPRTFPLTLWHLCVPRGSMFMTQATRAALAKLRCS
ncbi:MAG: hypothetical protein FE78DRAFT_76478 [Acidomyces sp. 'richmondensis']|nr:MAG: hypothetical protein FE78DRAFT_76478 [Acidomyces sp. 'richmondensis']